MVMGQLKTSCLVDRYREQAPSQIWCGVCLIYITCISCNPT